MRMPVYVCACLYDVAGSRRHLNNAQPLSVVKRVNRSHEKPRRETSLTLSAEKYVLSLSRRVYNRIVRRSLVSSQLSLVVEATRVFSAFIHSLCSLSSVRKFQRKVNLNRKAAKFSRFTGEFYV